MAGHISELGNMPGLCPTRDIIFVPLEMSAAALPPSAMVMGLVSPLLLLDRCPRLGQLSLGTWRPCLLFLQ